MSSKILMPALSPTMTEGVINQWLVKVGDVVRAGDIIAEIETDKATMEVEAVDEGFVEKLLFKEGDVNIPVNKNAHHTQFPATPFVLTISVTKLGVSAEKVVATIEIPKSHHGIFLPERKNSVTSFPDFFETIIPITNDRIKKAKMISQSMFSNCMLKVYLSIKLIG